MIVWRTMQTAKRGHTAEVVSWIKEWNAKVSTDSRVKGYRLLSSYVGDYELVINEVKFESVAEWEGFFNDLIVDADYSRWYEITTGYDHDFWVLEEES